MSPVCRGGRGVVKRHSYTLSILGGSDATGRLATFEMNPPTKLLHIVPATGGGESRPAPPRARPPFGRQLWRLRRAAGLTQEALARRAGYSAVYIGMLERGERAPLPATVDVLAGALALAADEHAALHVAARWRRSTPGTTPQHGGAAAAGRP